MKVRELKVKFGTQQSFGKKAFVKEDNEGTEYLYSYYSLIITNYGNACFNPYSNGSSFFIELTTETEKAVLVFQSLF